MRKDILKLIQRCKLKSLNIKIYYDYFFGKVFQINYIEYG